jgi:hypothetical protein
MIKAAEANVAAVRDKTIVIPGHGQPVSNKAELTEYRNMLVAIRENVAMAVARGHDCREANRHLRREVGPWRRAGWQFYRTGVSPATPTGTVTHVSA